MTDLTYTAEINTTLYSNYPPNRKVFLKKKKKISELVLYRKVCEPDTHTWSRAEDL